MKSSLQAFLNPKRKENLKFVLSSAFCDESGEPIEWEMRQLSATEGLDLQTEAQGKPYREVMLASIAESLVVPNLKDAELLKALSEREGKPIMEAVHALKLIANDAEVTALISRYVDYNEFTTKFNEKVQDAKN